MRAAWQSRAASCSTTRPSTAACRSARRLATVSSSSASRRRMAARAISASSRSVAVRFRSEPREVRLSGLDAKALGMQVNGEGTLTGSRRARGPVRSRSSRRTRPCKAAAHAAPPTVDVAARQARARDALRHEPHAGRAVVARPQADGARRRVSGNFEAFPASNGNVFRGWSHDFAVRARRVREGVRGDAAAAGINAKELGMRALERKFAFDSGADR